MLKSISTVYSGNDRYFWSINDSDLGETSTAYLVDEYIAVDAVMTFYSERNLPVAKNIAQYYTIFNKDARMLELKQDLMIMDVIAANIFKRHYYNCVKNRLKTLEWMGR
jgi:hypothetical protein